MHFIPVGNIQQLIVEGLFAIKQKQIYIRDCMHKDHLILFCHEKLEHHIRILHLLLYLLKNINIYL